MRIAKEFKVSGLIHIGLIFAVTIWPLLLPSRYRYSMPPVHTVSLIPEPPAAKNRAGRLKPKKAVIKKTAKKAHKKTVKKTLKKIYKAIPAPLSSSGLKERFAKRLEEQDKEAGSISPSPVRRFKPSARIKSRMPGRFQWYISLIQSKINSYWNEPETIFKKDYTAVITFTILSDGSVRDIHIDKSSGMPEFDNSAAGAVKSAQPFPQIPPGYTHNKLTVNVTFSLE